MYLVGSFKLFHPPFSSREGSQKRGREPCYSVHKHISIPSVKVDDHPYHLDKSPHVRTSTIFRWIPTTRHPLSSLTSFVPGITQVILLCLQRKMCQRWCLKAPGDRAGGRKGVSRGTAPVGFCCIWRCWKFSLPDLRGFEKYLTVTIHVYLN